MNTPVVCRSYLYVPASEPGLIAKALESDADAIVLDLEDAVAPERKGAARSTAAAVVAELTTKPVFVRVNGLTSGLTRADIEAVAGPGLAGIRLPKSEDADDVRAVAGWLRASGSAAGIVPIVESALGVERSFGLASADDAVVGLAMGEADLRADLGVSDDRALEYARSRCIVAARAARRPGTVQSVHTQLGDIERLRESTVHGRAMGFSGRSAIHPAQLAVINDVFTPSDAERDRARTIVAAYEEARSRGQAAVTTGTGEFVDEAVAVGAYATLALVALAERQGG